MRGNILKIRSLIILAGAFCVSSPLMASPSFITLSCREELENAFPASDAKGGCRPYSLIEQSSAGNLPLIDSASCYFDNHVSVYAYEKPDGLYLDTKSISGGATERVSSCDEIIARIQSIKMQKSDHFSPRQERGFLFQDSVLLVASEKNCELLKNEFSELLESWKSEGRVDSERLCIPDSSVAKKNPSLIRNFIQKAALKVKGIFLVGSDIAPFEFFYRTQWEAPWAEFKYGTTDLPYGNFSDSFWDKGISKKSGRLNGKIYREKEFIYKVSHPSFFAYDLDDWISFQFNRSFPYLQERWVSRWMADTKDLKTHFQKFVSRRKNFKPSEGQSALFARGAESIMFWPGDHSGKDALRAALKDWEGTMGTGSLLEIFAEADLEQLIRFIDRNTTFLSLLDHGQPEAVGNIQSRALENISWLPPMLNYDSCLAGSWGYASSPDESMIAHTFNVDSPPLVIVASQGIKSLITMGRGDAVAFDSFLNPTINGQPIGLRQIESFNRNLWSWKNQVQRDDFKADNVAQYFHSISFFGDGTWEF